MPTRKDGAHKAAREHEAANVAAQAPAEEGVEDIQVRWRKKAAQQAAAPTTSGAEDGVTAGAAEGTAGEEDGDWASRFKAEQARADDYFARWQRTAADLANMRRRHEQERQEYLKQANASLIAELLPVLDSFDRALAAIPAEAQESTWVDGVKLVERQLRMVLERNGLSIIEAEGKPFDPTEHEALMHEPSEQPADTVTGELQRGYKLHDRVLRPAMVKVAKSE